MQDKSRQASQQAKKKEQQIVDYRLPLGKTNFIIIGIALLMIVVGFILISGGATADGSFNPEIFNARRIVIGPTLAFLGFIAVGVGIMWNGKKKPANESDKKD